VKFSLLSKWFNAIAQAYNMGEAPFAYPDGTSEAIRVWNRALAAGQDPDEAVVAWAQANGVCLKRHRPMKFAG
jgi:hypothetical protein